MGVDETSNKDIGETYHVTLVMFFLGWYTKGNMVANASFQNVYV